LRICCELTLTRLKSVAASTTETKEQILTVAERLFAEHGFAGTTLRNVVSEAGVNLAAVNYHFGSKEELFRAVVARFARPVVERELGLLSKIKSGSEPPSIEALLRAVVQPSLEILSEGEDIRLVRAKFMGRCRTEPEPIQSIAYGEFSVATEAFLDMFQRALPEQPRSQLGWKFDLVISALVRVLMEAGKPYALLRSNRAEDIEAATQQLVAFLSPGMQT
jgi:AcrR family transcriptional regulator